MEKRYYISILIIFLVLFFGFAGAVFAYNNSCGECVSHAYKLCSGNGIYWFDSCGNQEDLADYCSGANIICQYGECVYHQPAPAYVKHYKTTCNLGDVYWYDSYGKIQDIYKSCKDSNSCTEDLCVSGKCSNNLLCDGSTCAVDGKDYKEYCGSTDNNSEDVSNNDNNSSEQTVLAVSFFEKNDLSQTQWQKEATATSNSQVYFLISVVNGSDKQVDNIRISTNIPAEVSMLGNLKIDGVQVSGDIVSGIDIGSLSSGAAKQITFEGKIQSVESESSQQAVVTVSASGSMSTDSISMSFDSSQIAAVSESQEIAFGLWQFLKRWYLWIIAGLVLIFLFAVVFRRLSSDI